jgi:hypothetical protein
MQMTRWHTVDCDADGVPSRQAAELDFQREGWPPGRYRVTAIRTNERDSGRQVLLAGGPRPVRAILRYQRRRPRDR